MLSYTRYPDLDFTHFVSEGETIVSAVRIDEQEAPEDSAEEAVAEEMLGRGSEETVPNTTAHSDKNIEGEPGG